MRAISPNWQTGVVPHVFSRLEQLAQARSPPRSTQGSASPLLFGQDLVKVSANHFEPATFALAIRKAWIPEPSRRSTPSPSLQFHSRRSRSPIPRISHTAPQKHESLGPTGVQDVLLSVAPTARQLGVCTATVYTLCARGHLPHIRILNTLRIPEGDLKTFVAARRAATQHP